MDKKKKRSPYKKTILQVMASYLKKNYDVIVCGAGPAGLYAANCLQKSSPTPISVLLLDRKLPWKEPVACAEAVSRKIFSRYWKPNEAWIRQHLDGVYFTSPDMTRVDFRMDDCGLILNRAAFHHEMADSAAKLGVECHFADSVCRLEKAKNSQWQVTVRSAESGEETVLSAKAVIDATGPGSKITRGVPGLESLETGNYDLESAVFAIAENVPHNPRRIELFFGSEFFAGGYGWIFPRDGKTVNIGLVGARAFLKTHPPLAMLQKFMAKEYPEAKILEIHGGAIPCGQSDSPTAALGVFKAGDSASTVNPISRSGIVEALKSGKIAAESALEWIHAKTDGERQKIEQSALTRWMKIQGKTHRNYHRAKNGFASIRDAQFNRSAHRLAAIPESKRTLFRIFWTVLSSTPGLLWKMRSFFV